MNISELKMTVLQIRPPWQQPFPCSVQPCVCFWVGWWQLSHPSTFFLLLHLAQSWARWTDGSVLILFCKRKPWTFCKCSTRRAILFSARFCDESVESHKPLLPLPGVDATAWAQPPPALLCFAVLPRHVVITRRRRVQGLWAAGLPGDGPCRADVTGSLCCRPRWAPVSAQSPEHRLSPPGQAGTGAGGPRAAWETGIWWSWQSEQQEGHSALHSERLQPWSEFCCHEEAMGLVSWHLHHLRSMELPWHSLLELKAESASLDFRRFQSSQNSPLHTGVLNKQANRGRSAGCSFIADTKIVIVLDQVFGYRWHQAPCGSRIHIPRRVSCREQSVPLGSPQCRGGGAPALLARLVQAPRAAAEWGGFCSSARKWCGTCSCACPGIYFPQDSRVYTSWLICEPWKHFEKVKQTVHWRIICHQ